MKDIGRVPEFPPSMPGASLIGDEELKELRDVVESKSPFRHYGIGKPGKAERLESIMRSEFDAKHALAVSSGTAALLAASAAIGIGEGDEVILPSLAWYSDYSAVASFAATPVFVDIGEDLNIDPEDAKRKITARTKAIIVVHYQGGAAKIDEIMKIAEKKGIKVIEDCAQALGGEYKGRKLGSFGDAAAASFQTHKMLTSGEGGAFWTNDDLLFERAVRYHDLGLVRPCFASELPDEGLSSQDRAFMGLQMRMSELQAAFLIAQFGRLGEIVSSCRSMHGELLSYVERRYSGRFRVRSIDGDIGIAFIFLARNKAEAEAIIASMTEDGIPCGATTACSNLMEKEPIKSGLMEDGRRARRILSPCPNVNSYLGRAVSIPIGPLYKKEHIAAIIRSLDKAAALAEDMK